MAVELYPNTMPTIAYRDLFSDEVWVQSNSGMSSVNAAVRNVTVTCNVAFGNVKVNVANHVIRFSGTQNTGFTDNVVYVTMLSNTYNSYYWLTSPTTVDLYSAPANSNNYVYQVNSDQRSSITVTYTLDIQYSAGGANDVVTINRSVTQNVTSAYTYLRTLYP